jgi:murein DD-endopeptidase MepM/ murein hydrolase activator NlpD
MRRNDEAFDALVIGGLILLAMTTKRTIVWGGGWMWPIPDLVTASPTLGGFKAKISQEYRDTGVTHYGVDLMWWGPDGWFAPEGAPVAAARAGKVWSVELTPRGWAVVLDHGPPWATFYQHLSEVGVVTGDQVVAGQEIGKMGADPLDPAHTRHLHFAAWYRGSGDPASVDPAPAMESWGRWRWAWKVVA